MWASLFRPYSNCSGTFSINTFNKFNTAYANTNLLRFFSTSTKEGTSDQTPFVNVSYLKAKLYQDLLEKLLIALKDFKEILKIIKTQNQLLVIVNGQIYIFKSDDIEGGVEGGIIKICDFIGVLNSDDPENKNFQKFLNNDCKEFLKKMGNFVEEINKINKISDSEKIKKFLNCIEKIGEYISEYISNGDVHNMTCDQVSNMKAKIKPEIEAAVKGTTKSISKDETILNKINNKIDDLFKQLKAAKGEDKVYKKAFKDFIVNMFELHPDLLKYAHTEVLLVKKLIELKLHNATIIFYSNRDMCESCEALIKVYAEKYNVNFIVFSSKQFGGLLRYIIVGENYEKVLKIPLLSGEEFNANFFENLYKNTSSANVSSKWVRLRFCFSNRVKSLFNSKEVTDFIEKISIILQECDFEGKEKKLKEEECELYKQKKEAGNELKKLRANKENLYLNWSKACGDIIFSCNGYFECLKICQEEAQNLWNGDLMLSGFYPRLRSVWYSLWYGDARIYYDYLDKCQSFDSKMEKAILSIDIEKIETIVNKCKNNIA